MKPLANMSKEKLQSLLDTENLHLNKLHDIVIQSIEEEKLISEKLYGFEEKNPPFTSLVADKVTAFGDSWSFILLFVD